jgi:adenylylsulfate kinase
MKRRNAGFVIWITGLSGSGKTTLAKSGAEKLNDLGQRSVVLDGDDLRRGLCSDLGFSLNDRAENVRRVAEAANLFQAAGFITFVALISPTRDSRQKARDIIGAKHFFEVWCRCSISCCEKRDSKNLYQRARSGQLKDFTGLTSVYENPLHPQLIIDTDRFSPTESLQMLFHALQHSEFLRS